MNTKPFLLSAMTVMATGALSAQSIAFKEDFNNDYSASFPVLLELDNQAPLNNFRPLFTDNDGVARPWWRLKDSSASPDGFLGSHSAYLKPSTSNDWVVSRPIEIPTQGYNLTFGAQSFVMRTSGDRISDLWVFITEYEPSEDNLPSEPAMLIERVPEGRFPEDIENDFTEYSINLDQYAGKTIYLSFANLNYDKDILVIDNILVQRDDKVSLQAASARYVEKGDFQVNVEYLASMDETVRNWRLVFNPGTGAPEQEISGDALVPGDLRKYTFAAPVAADATADWTVTLYSEGNEPVIATGTVTGLSFIPFHRVLLEESTGTWCGNCPLGIYAMEQMVHHPEMKDYVIPVSVHINGSPTDYMVDDDYAYWFGVSSAPALRVDRNTTVKYFSNQYDAVPVNLEESRGIAYQVKSRHEETSLMAIDVEGAFRTQGNDTTAIDAKVRIRPAMTLEGRPYRIGFALVEGNVASANDRFWKQHNYYSGMTGLAGDLDGFVNLPEEISGWIYQDVARSVIGFHGVDEIVMPATLEMDREYEYTVTLPIPDKKNVLDSGTVLSDAVVAGHLTVVAFVLDSDNTFAAVNSAAYPMTPAAAVHTSIADQTARILASLGVRDMESADVDAEPEYFTLQGVRVAVPSAPGIYVVRRGDSVKKEIIK